MSTPFKAMLARVSFALVQEWTRLYTMRMPPAARAARSMEIESDLWESWRAEKPSAWLPVHVIGRLILGMPDDLRWRAEQVTTPYAARLTIAIGVATAVLVSALWVGAAASRIEPPQAPPAPDLRWRPKNPPPPPPPPPPPF